MDPDLGLAAGLFGITCGVNRIENGLFLIEIRPIAKISAMPRTAEKHDPPRSSGLVANVKLHSSHQLNPVAGRSLRPMDQISVP